MMNKNLYRKLGWIVISASYIVLSSSSLAAPGTLPSSPLFVSNSSEPNIFFTLDDSGSMESEIMTRNGTAGLSSSTIQGQVELEGWFRYYMFPIDSNGRDGYYPYHLIDELTGLPYTDEHGNIIKTNAGIVPSTQLSPKSWVLRNSTGNKLYYNPDIEYSPWPGGKDSSGDPYEDKASIEEAWIDPNNKAFGTFNLIKDISYWAVDYLDPGPLGPGNYFLVDSMYPATYFDWKDENGDGEIQLTEYHEAIEIRSERDSYPSGRDYEDEIQNFANWFQYHRKRSFAAKAAVGHVIFNTDSSRMGLEFINKQATSPLSKVASMSDPVSKDSLINTLYHTGIFCGPGKNATSDPVKYPNTCLETPSRTALQRVGEMFNDPLTSPIQSVADGGECQQNFNIFLSDGYWNEEVLIGQDAKDFNNIGNADKDGGTVEVNSFDGDADTSNDGGNYEDSYSVTLADVAMYYYKNDLNTSLANKVPTITGQDEADHQHLVTYTVGFGLTGTLDPETDNPVTGGSTFWPNPMDAVDDERVDDLWHAAYNGRGEYLNAQNPTDLRSALSTSIQDINFRTATSAAVAVNSARLTSESVVYLAQFDSSEWTGNLFAFPITDISRGTLSLEPKWEAGSSLTNRDFRTRQIITYDGSNGVPFVWDTAKLSSAMIADLRTSPSGGIDDAGEARLAYLRGDRSNEDAGYLFRNRPSLLGDIVNAGPVFVGEATLNWPDTAPFPDTAGSRYSDFKNGIPKTRTKLVYVGSNDGLLHAFDDNSGNELFAYAPNILASKDSNKGYHYLTDPNYRHNWYVDQTPTLSDVYMNTNNGPGWHTILVGGLRGGGRGLYALDVTNPASLNQDNADKVAMWEFNHADDPDGDLGYTYSRPAIAMGNDGKWYAIFGNGYNDTGTTGDAQLFIVDIESGINNAWALGTNYWKISTGAGTPDNRNGLATPALADVDGNGTVDRVYAGDLQGNMWVFDLSGTTPGSWGSAYTAGQDAVPLFTTAANQPITAKPVLSRHPTMPDSSSPDNSPNLMVLFGTGQYLANADKTSTSPQAFYGVWDDGTSALNPVDNLIHQTYNTTDYPDHRVLNRHQVDYEFKHGWWIDLDDTGERVVTTAIARHTEVFFNSFVPVTDSCTIGGYGYKFAIDIATGGSPKDTVIDVNEDGEINESDNVNGTGVVAAIRQNGYLPEPVFIEDLVFTGSKASKIKKLPYVPSGRFSWQELIK